MINDDWTHDDFENNFQPNPLYTRSRIDVERIAELEAMLTKFLPSVTYGKDGEEIEGEGNFEWDDPNDTMITELKAVLSGKTQEIGNVE